jgi:hypothetical protein
MDCFYCYISSISSFLRRISCNRHANLTAIGYKIFTSGGCKMDFNRIGFAASFDNYFVIVHENAI